MAKATREAYGEKIAQLVQEIRRLLFWMQTWQALHTVVRHRKYVRKDSLIWVLPKQT